MKAGEALISTILGIAFLFLAVWIAGASPAHAQACADPILAFSPPPNTDTLAVAYLGRDSSGLPIFLATAPDGSWRIFVMRAPELVCVILAGHDAPCRQQPLPENRCRDPPAR